MPKSSKEISQKPPFTLSSNSAHLSVECEDCSKPRIVFRKPKPSKQDINKFIEYADSICIICGAIVDETREWAMNTKLSCGDDIENVYNMGRNDVIHVVIYVIKYNRIICYIQTCRPNYLLY